jgi:hypothetical protein
LRNRLYKIDYRLSESRCAFFQIENTFCIRFFANNGRFGSRPECLIILRRIRASILVIHSSFVLLHSFFIPSSFIVFFPNGANGMGKLPKNLCRNCLDALPRFQLILALHSQINSVDTFPAFTLTRRPSPNSSTSNEKEIHFTIRLL